MLELITNIVQAISEMLRGFHPIRYLVSSRYRQEVRAQWNTDKKILAAANVLAASLILVGLLIGVGLMWMKVM